MEKAMVKITRCDVEDCSYNRNQQCHTLAITVGDPGEACPNCDTYLKGSHKGGLPDITGGVGACKVDICKMNKSFECTANSITVGLHQGHPDCKSFQRK